MITIHQIQLTADQIDLINEKGHDAVPAQSAKLAVSIFGADKFKAENFKFYTEAYQVDTTDLEKAFEWTNLWNNQKAVDVIGDHGYSSSTGDIFEVNGQYFMCGMMGFEKLEMMKEAA